MDNREAKFILRAYRPGGADAGNVVFGEVLDQAKRDPELRVWFEREQARDKAIAAKLKSVPIPAGLRESILAGGRMSASQRSWWQQPTWLAMAASVAILLTATFVWQLRAPRTDWDQLTAQIMEDAAHEDRHGSGSADAQQLVALLSLETTKLSAPLPIDLAKLKTDGCRSLTIAGHEVMEVCFKRKGGVFHLYAMARPSSRDIPAEPRFETRNGLHSVMWTDLQHLYVMTSAKDEFALKALL